MGKVFPREHRPFAGSLAFPLKDVADPLSGQRDDDEAALRRRMTEAAAALDAALCAAREFNEPPNVVAPEQKPR